MLAVTGDAQDFHQFALFSEQQSIALLHPDRQAPDLHQCLADVQQAHTKQLLFDFTCRLTFMDDPQFPVFEQFWMGQRQRPQGRKKQQATPVDVLPQARQATGKKTIGLLRGVLADHLQLTQGFGDFELGFGGQACEQLFGALQAEAIDRDLEVFRRFGHAAVGVPVGFANHAQGQGGAALHEVGDIAQRAAIVADGLADPVVAGLRNRQAHAIEQLDPAFERRRFWCWNVRFVNHGGRRSSSTIPVPGRGQISFSPELAIVWRSFADK
ncbi:hypothetical protein D3C81_1502870 [compost metagenome]